MPRLLLVAIPIESNIPPSEVFRKYYSFPVSPCCPF